MSTKKIVLIVLALVAAICFMSTVFFGLIFGLTYFGTQSPIKAANHFFIEGKNGNIDRAYSDLTTKEFRFDVSKSNLNDYFNELNIQEYENIFITSRDILNDVATLNGTIKINGSNSAMSLILYKVEGKWLIQNINIDE